MQTELKSTTPGPWKAQGASIKAVSHGKWFNVAVAKVRGYTPEGNAANAALIASAPSLLAQRDELREALNNAMEACTEAMTMAENLRKHTGGAIEGAICHSLRAALTNGQALARTEGV